MTLPALCLFDLGGVVARYSPERRLPELASLLGADAEVVQEVVWSSGLSKRFDAGEFDLDAMCAELERQFGAAVAPASVSRVWCLAFEPCERVLELARRVGARCEIGLFTNNPPALEVGLARHLPRIAARFDTRFFSCRLGALKPSPEAYEEVEHLTSLPSRSLALIDDSAQNVDAAQRRGWSALRFTDADSLRQQLELLGWAAT